MKRWNGRFVLFCKGHKLKPDKLIDGDGVTTLDLGKGELPWTAYFMFWLDEKWHEWALSLGYKNHNAAQADGHTGKEFDVWLEENL